MGEARGWYSRGYAPHFDSPERVQHVVFRTGDSLPPHVRLEEIADVRERARAFDEALDEGRGARPLAGAVAALVEATLLHFDGQRYRLLSWCVMPNHVHVVFEQIEGWTLAGTIKSWKSYSATQINRATGRSGAFWARDYFDRFMRNETHLATTIAYVENNPVKAGLCARPEAWRYGSAYRRWMPV